MGDNGQVEVLIPQSGNPHYYQLRPSDVRKLRDSDFFFWIGPNLESFLTKILHANNVENVALYDDIHMDNKHEHGENDDGHNDLHSEDKNEHGHEDEHAHNHAHNTDMHLWLDPAEALHMAEMIKDSISGLNSEQEAEINQNLKAFEIQIAKLISEYQEKFSATQTRPIYSRHNSLTHLARRFNLNIAGSVSETPEKRPGISHLSRLNRQITNAETICYLIDSTGSDKYLDGISGDVEIKKTRIDILANDTENTAQGYTDFMRKLLDEVYDCAYGG